MTSDREKSKPGPCGERSSGDFGGSLESSRWQEKSPDEKVRRQAVLEDIRSHKRVSKDLRGISLAGEDLQGTDFSGCDLANADFTGANLSGARFFKSTVRSTLFTKARLVDCEFVGSDLTGSDLHESVADGATFGQADLTDSRLFQASLKKASFGGARLENADLRLADLEEANIQKADLSFTDFTRANLRGADLSESDVFQAIFVYTNLSGSRLKRIQRFERANWIGADITDIDLHGAHLVRRFIMDENYLHEFRSKSKFSEFLYRIWWLTSDCGRSFLRWAGWTGLVVVLFAFLFGLVDIQYGLHDSSFLTRLYYSVVTLTTLGYGDIVPLSATGKVLVILEVILGYLTLGGLISILANKMARRAE